MEDRLLELEREYWEYERKAKAARRKINTQMERVARKEIKNTKWCLLVYGDDHPYYYRFIPGKNYKFLRKFRDFSIKVSSLLRIPVFKNSGVEIVLQVQGSSMNLTANTKFKKNLPVLVDFFIKKNVKIDVLLRRFPGYQKEMKAKLDFISLSEDILHPESKTAVEALKNIYEAEVRR